MDDLISRKALLAEYDRVHIGPPGGARKLIAEAPSVDAPHWATEQAYKNGYEQGKKDALAKDNNVPSKWVPVSERLPQADEPEASVCEQVQVLLSNGFVTTGWCNRYYKVWWHLNHGETHFVGFNYEDTPVVAWQPLAEPPKGE